MSTLTLLAILIQLADAGQTCAALRLGAREQHPLLGARPSCATVLAFTGAQLAPLALPLSPRWRLGVQTWNVGSGSAGIGASVVLFWGRR